MLKTYFQLLKAIDLRAPQLVYCIGSMGSGKTTLSLLTYYGLKTYLKREVRIHYYNGGDCGWECLNLAIEDIRQDPKNSVSYVIFDDYSFILYSRSKEYYEFFTNLFRIRHLTGKNKILIWFNGHYSRSLSPFIRSTNYRVLTSISPAEIRQYSNEYLFRIEDLWEYYNYYVSHPKKHIILCEFRGISKIIDVTINRDRIREELKNIYNIIYTPREQLIPLSQIPYSSTDDQPNPKEE